MAKKSLTAFVIVNDELYHRDKGGVLARAWSLIEAKGELHQVHVLSCGNDDVAYIDACRNRDFSGLNG